MSAPSPLTPFAPLPPLGGGVGGGGKQELRASIRSLLAHLTPEQRAEESRVLCHLLLDRIPPDARSICAFAPLTDEPDIIPALETLIARQVELSLPRVTAESMTFHQISGFSELTKGPQGFLEPAANAPVPDPLAIDLVLVPGVAFDEQGNRLGRGQGHYDRWIGRQRALVPQTRFWGIAFSCQMVDHIPTEPHDARLDSVFSP